MKRIVFALAVVFFAFGFTITPAKAQQAVPGTRESLQHEGDSLRSVGNLPGAVAKYLRASAEADQEAEIGEKGLQYILATTYALQPDKADSAFYFLEQSLPKMTSMRVLHDPDLYFLVRDDRWKKVETELLDQLESRVSGSFNRNLASRLLSMRRNEWIGRYHIMLLFRQSGGQSPVLSLLSDDMQNRHLDNEADLAEILDTFGWPYISAVGAEAAYAAGNVLTHMNLETRERYLPLLEKACRAGEADWSDYAPAFDRTELEAGRPQVYGTQMEWDDEKAAYVPQQLLEPENVEKRRAEKGLEPLVDQLEKFNAAMKRDFGNGG